ncbi:MAG: immunoglobulin domain-containing protein [Burkholderiaceae bacterium]|jgi:hypothetical protein|nr:immunoglobulin domain-containing protein [Burkholderiaceae bacterium]
MHLPLCLYRLVVVALAMSLAAMLAGCGGSDDPTPTAPAAPPPPTVTAPAITSQPAAVSVVEGQTATFSVAASGSAPLTYQWRRNGSDIAGATTSAYSLTTTLADNGAAFSVLVRNGAGSATSNPASLVVTRQAIVPAIAVQPVAASFSAGGTVSFSATASGSPPLAYRWLIAGGADLVDGAGRDTLAGASISGADTATLTLANVPAGASGVQFAVRVSNAAGTATSSPAPLTLAGSVTQRISAAAGGSVRAGGEALLIDFPAGALDGDATVTVWPAASIADFAAEFREVSGTLWNLAIAGGKLLPGRAAQVRFRIDPATLPARVAQAGRDAQVRATTAPPGGDGTPWTVVRCEDGAPRTEIGQRTGNDWSSPVVFCESGGQTTGAIGLVINRTPVPGTTVYDVALGSSLATMRRWTWAGVDAAGQVTLAYRDAAEAAFLARLDAAGELAVNVRVPGADPSSTDTSLWPRVVPYALASNGALAGLWRGADGMQRRARAEAYGVAPFGSGRLLTQRRFVRTFAVNVPADDTTPVRGIDFAPSGELAVHEWTRLNLYANAATTPRISQVLGTDFPNRPAGAGDGAAASDATLALDAAGNVYKVGRNSTTESGTQFCGGGCPAIYKYSPTGQPLWFRVLSLPGGAQGPTLAIDPQGRPVIRYQDATGRDLVTRLNAANGDITGGVDLGRLAFAGSLNTLTFDAAGNTYAGLGRYLARIGPDFNGQTVALLEFGQGQTGDYRAIGADRAGNAYGIFTSGAGTANAQFRLVKARYP